MHGLDAFAEKNCLIAYHRSPPSGAEALPRASAPLGGERMIRLREKRRPHKPIFPINERTQTTVWVLSLMGKIPPNQHDP